MRALFLAASCSISSLAFSAGSTTPGCTYDLAKDSVAIGWTAFKTTAKTPVNGIFKVVNVAGASAAKSLADAVRGVTVTVDQAQIDTGNPARDKTLQDFFFSKLAGPVSGHVTSVTEKDGKIVIALTLNGATQELDLNYAIKDDKEFSANGTLDVLKFGAQAPLDSLHRQCEELHKGPDGVSKTWSEVQVHLTGRLEKHCTP